MSVAPPSSANQGVVDGSAVEEMRAPRRLLSARGRQRDDKRHDPNPLGCVLAAGGAIAIIVSTFLPAYQSNQPTLLGIQSNTFIQESDGTGWVLVALGVGVLVATYRSYSAHIRTWSVLILGGLTVAAAIRLGTHHPDLYRIGLDGTPDLSNPIGSGAGIAVYVAAAGGLLAALGGRIMREPRATSAPAVSDVHAIVEPLGVEATKRCPDCAESVLAGARVCKHCGYHFQPSGTPRVGS